MTKLVLLLVLAALPAVSFAASTPNRSVRDMVVAEFEYKAAYGPRMQHKVLRIHASGRVVALRSNEETVVAHLGDEAVERLREVIAAWTPTDVVDLDKGKKGCSDGPARYYSVYQGDKAHPIKERVTCHNHEITDLKDSGLDLVYDTLNVFERLAF